MHPQFGQMPPSFSFSTSIVSPPALAAVCAAKKPAVPPPIMITSVSAKFGFFLPADVQGSLSLSSQTTTLYFPLSIQYLLYFAFYRIFAVRYL
jgi:hypothetical protein